MSNSIPIGSLLDSASESDSKSNELKVSNTSFVFCHVFAPGTISLTDDWIVNKTSIILALRLFDCFMFSR